VNPEAVRKATKGFTGGPHFASRLVISPAARPDAASTFGRLAVSSTDSECEAMSLCGA